jgi:hypothetical protein
MGGLIPKKLKACVSDKKPIPKTMISIVSQSKNHINIEIIQDQCHFVCNSAGGRDAFIEGISPALSNRSENGTPASSN